MTERQKKSILEMARGSMLERVDYEMSKVMANIRDPNTPATKKRKITVTLELKPDDDRENIAVSVTAKSNLVPTNPIVTFLAVADDENVVEMVSQLPGQLGMEGGEQESPPLLKLVK